MPTGKSEAVEHGEKYRKERDASTGVRRAGYAIFDMIGAAAVWALPQSTMERFVHYASQRRQAQKRPTR